MLSDEYSNNISTYCLGRNKICGDGDKKIRQFTFIIILYIIFALIIIFKKDQLQIAINLALKNVPFNFHKQNIG